MGSRGGGRAERQGNSARSGIGLSVPEGSRRDAPEHAHSFHSTVERAHRAGSRVRTIPRRSIIRRLGKIEAIEELGLEVLVLRLGAKNGASVELPWDGRCVDIDLDIDIAT